MDQATNDNQLDLREFARVLQRQRWVVAIAVGVLVIIGVGLSLVETPTYAASSIVLVPANAKAAVSAAAPQSFTTSDILNRQLQNEIIFARSDAVHAEVRKLVGRASGISITPVPNADALSFVAQDSSPARASREANGYARAYLDQRRRTNTDNYLGTGSVLQAQINSLRRRQAGLPRKDPSQLGIRAAITNLESSLANLQASGQLSQVSGDLINRATVPAVPVSPNLPRNVLIAGFLGLIFGTWAAFARDRMADAIRSKEDLNAATPGVSTLGLIPWIDGWPDRARPYIVSAEHPRSGGAEAYRSLRTAVNLLSLDDQIRTIAITSASASEGKSSTVANLAVVLASADRRVTLVDADLRRPRLDQFFGVAPRLGLTSVLAGESRLTDALQEVPGHPGLRILTSGPHPPNPSELLAMPGVAALFSELRNQTDSDIVLIDCPPVLPVPDALQISRLVDGVLLVANAGRTKRRQLSRALELLRQLGAPLFGTVLNGVRLTGGYGYGYGYGHGDSESPDGDRGTGQSNGAVDSGFRVRLVGRKKP